MEVVQLERRAVYPGPASSELCHGYCLEWKLVIYCT
jgi:hypothetical protein